MGRPSQSPARRGRQDQEPQPLDAVQAIVDAPKGSVEALVRLAAVDMAGVDALITERLDSPVPVIPALAEHLIAAGGKRLRPLLTVAAARLAGSDNDGC